MNIQIYIIIINLIIYIFLEIYDCITIIPFLKKSLKKLLRKYG